MANSLAVFVENPLGMIALALSPEMAASLKEHADKAVEAAKQEWAASGPHPYETGAYLASLKAAIQLSGRRLEGVAYTDSDHGAYIEFGTEDTPTFAPLRRGAERAGLRLVGGGRL